MPLIKMGRKWRKYDLRITLISAEPYLIYSGALPQYMAGFYTWEQTAIDLENLCNRYDVPFRFTKVVSINKDRKTVTTSDGSEISYDYLLLNIGALTKPILEGKNVSAVKPMSKLLDLREKICSGDVDKLLIVGGGAAGSELAMNFSHPQQPNRPRITVVDTNARLLSSFPNTLSTKVASILNQRGVTVLTGQTATEEFAGKFDQTILAAGNQPGSVSIDHSFKTGKGDRILTDNTLRVAGTNSVFAAGDLADVGGNNFPQIGVHAVKQGVVLRKNIKSLLLNKPLVDYKPYSVNPLILSDGPDHAFYVIEKFVLSGRIFAILKNVLDMRWLEKYSKPPEERRSVLQLLRDGYFRTRSKMTIEKQTDS